MPPISQPTTPDEVLTYFERIEFGIDPPHIYWCAPDNVFFILQTELERYIKECAACPSWQQPKPKEKANVESD